MFCCAGLVENDAQQCVLLQHPQYRDPTTAANTAWPGLALPGHWLLSGHWSGRWTYVCDCTLGMARIKKLADMLSLYLKLFYHFNVLNNKCIHFKLLESHKVNLLI